MNPLSDNVICKYFLSWQRLSFYIFNVYFETKALKRSSVSLSNFSLVACAFGAMSKKPSLIQGHRALCLVFHLSFIVFLLHLGINYILHFKFLIWLKSSFQFSLFACGYPVVRALFVEKIIFFSMTWHHRQGHLAINVGLFLDSILFHWSVCLSPTSASKFWLLKFRNSC